MSPAVDCNGELTISLVKDRQQHHSMQFPAAPDLQHRHLTVHGRRHAGEGQRPPAAFPCEADGVSIYQRFARFYRPISYPSIGPHTGERCVSNKKYGHFFIGAL